MALFEVLVNKIAAVLTYILNLEIAGASIDVLATAFVVVFLVLGLYPKIKKKIKF